MHACNTDQDAVGAGKAPNLPADLLLQLLRNMSRSWRVLLQNDKSKDAWTRDISAAFNVALR